MFKGIQFITILLLIALSSCAPKTQNRDPYTYHDDGTPKPKVAFVPVLDKSSSGLGWSLSDEFTESFGRKMQESGLFFLTNDFEILARACQGNDDLNLFTDSLEWLSESHSSTEFIVFVEIIDHTLTPKSKEGNWFNLLFTPSYALDIALRVRVIDTRDKKARIILQEIVVDSFNIPWRPSSADYRKEGWSKATFALTPMGLAHTHIVRTVAQRIQDYILLNSNYPGRT
jgi:hypothetical protein